MKVSPVSAATNTLGAVSMDNSGQPAMQSHMRSLKMKTIATPGYVPNEPEQETEQPPPQAAQTQTEAPITDETKAADEATQPLSPQYAALAKARRALQQEKQAFDRMKAEFEASKAQSTDAIDKARLTSDPLGVLLDAGVTFDQLSEAVIAYQNGGVAGVRELKNEIKTLKDTFEKQLSERDQQAIQQAAKKLQFDGERLSQEGDEFALLRHEKGIPKVVEYIVEKYKETGDVLDLRETMQRFEKFHRKEANAKAELLKKLSGEQSPIPPTQPVQQQRQPMRTLTNRDTASVPMDRKARALAAFRGTLKT